MKIKKNFARPPPCWQRRCNAGRSVGGRNVSSDRNCKSGTVGAAVTSTQTANRDHRRAAVSDVQTSSDGLQLKKITM